MPIKKDEIEKYIFDPNNPKLCKSYNLLLKIAKKDNYSFFSPEFLQYFFAEQILTDDFKNELWDIPDDYDSLTFNEKVSLFRKQLAVNDLDDLMVNLSIDTYKIEKYSFFKRLYAIDEFHFDDSSVSKYITKKDFQKYITKYIFENENMFLNKCEFDEEEYNKRVIFFSKNYLYPLSSNITRASIMITMEENIDEFLDYEQENIKPIFLKKIEDVDLLLDVLQNDIDKSKGKNIIKKDISTIDSINIKDFFSIKKLKIDKLKNKKEIYIVGENGDGKTLLLQAIACALKGVNEDGQGAFRNIQNDFSLEIIDSLNDSFKCEKSHTYENLLAYGAMRNNNCNHIEDKAGFLTLFNNSLDLKNPIKWLITLDHSEKKGEKNFISVTQAKQLIKHILNDEVDNIEITSTNVSFTEKGSPVEFDRLSAGYKGSITILCDILIRLSTNQPHITDIKEYQGIVLIDEVELHLHPRWEYEFMQKLRGFFPLVQFIVTTHSPTVILGASKEAVFFNIYKDDGNICISNQKPIKDNFLNEIQTNVFNFDINKQRITYPREEDKKQNQKARKSLLKLIDTIEKDK